ncbi:hypothetical protein [Xanthomonas phage JGB6]|nr:hypothetical protein [Xanthomonas phage JGB6]
MHKPIDVIDSYSEDIKRSLDIMVYSLGGLYEKIARDNPTPQGIREFLVYTRQISDQSVANAISGLRSGIEALRATLDESQALQRVRLIHSDDDSEELLGVAQEAFGAFFAQARVFYAKRLREIVSARAFGYDTYSQDPRIMVRNGASWNFSEYAYLTARQYLVSWYNETKIQDFAERGVEEFTLLTDDPELIHSVYRVEDYPQYAEKLFHPRTTKLVGSEYVPS